MIKFKLIPLLSASLPTKTSIFKKFPAPSFGIKKRLSKSRNRGGWAFLGFWSSINFPVADWKIESATSFQFSGTWFFDPFAFIFVSNLNHGSSVVVGFPRDGRKPPLFYFKFRGCPLHRHFAMEKQSPV